MAIEVVAECDCVYRALRTMMANPMLSARQVAAQLGLHSVTFYWSLATP